VIDCPECVRLDAWCGCEESPTAPAPAASQVWRALGNPRDEDTIVAVQPTNIPGVELLVWGARGRVHTHVDSTTEPPWPHDHARYDAWPPPDRMLVSGPDAPWAPIEDTTP
jgi:hypothetical protein